MIYEWQDGTFAGIRYSSRLGDDVENWAVFEREASGFEALRLQNASLEDDPEFHQALRTLCIAMI